MWPLISPILSLLFFLFLHHGSSPAVVAVAGIHNSDIIVETCKRCSESSANVNYDLCVESLRSVPKSHRSDLQGLGLISVELAIANATHVQSTAKKLLKAKPRNHYVRSCLKTCVALYVNAISGLNNSAKAIKLGRYNDANILISSAVDAPRNCEDSFKEGKIKSPLVEDDDHFFQLAVIALAITAILEQSL